MIRLFRLRPAGVDDAYGIAAVHVASWQETYRGHIPQDYLDSLSVDRRAARWAQLLAGPAAEERVTVAVGADGAVVGFAGTGPSTDPDVRPGQGEVQTIYLDPSVWRQGLGTRLLAAAEDDLRAGGATTATLWVLSANERARRFYEARGWAPDGAAQTDVRETFTLHEVRYGKAL